MAFELNKEQKVLLNILSASLSKNPESFTLNKEELDGVDWLAVAKESIHQAVCLISLEYAKPYLQYIPSEIHEKWKNYAFRIAGANAMVVQSQVEMTEILGDKHPYVILKGSSACAYYPNENLRALGDVDFLIDPKEKEELTNLFVEKGYELSCGDHPNHLVFKKPRAHLEMHFEVAGVPFGEKGKMVNEYLKDAVFTPVVKKHDFSEFNAPKDEHHALILLLHMQHHLVSEGVGLRHLSDWGAFMNCVSELPFWQEKLIPFLKSIGLFTFTAIITKTCAKYLGSVCPAWAKDVDDEVCDQIIEDVLTGGNFGRKDGVRSKSGMLISEHGKGGTKRGKFYNLAHALHGHVLRTKCVKKCVVLYPFVYCFKAIKYICMIIVGKRPSITKMLPEAEKRKKIYDKLEIFETEGK